MNINEIKTPALDKLLEVQDQMDLCRNFLEYFLKNYSAFELEFQLLHSLHPESKIFGGQLIHC